MAKVFDENLWRLTRQHLTLVLLALATLLGPALRSAWVAPGAGAWRPEGLPLLLASIAALTVIDALLNSFVFFPAIVAAGGLAAGAAREER